MSTPPSLSPRAAVKQPYFSFFPELSAIVFSPRERNRVQRKFFTFFFISAASY